jgi:energy-coupling factor transport system ATP-binding protein
VIELACITYRYPETTGEPVLRDLEAVLDGGSSTLVTGASGAGKSTLLRLVNGLVPHFHGGRLRGRVGVFGRDPVTLGPAAMSDLVGFVQQDPEAQLVTTRVEDELAFALENFGTPVPEMRRRVGEVLERLGLVELRRRRLDTLSGGERQRVAVGGALALRPRVLVLDEPTSQLDPESAEDLLALVEELHRDGLTVVLAEHRLERVRGLADAVIELRCPGVPPRVGTPEDLLPPAGDPPRSFAEAARRIAASTETGETAEPSEAETTTGSPVLAARDLFYSYPGAAREEPVLAGVSLDLHPGDRVALFGRNGSGKSTLLKLLAGLLSPDAGGIALDGEDAAGLPLARRARRVGFVPQNPGRLLFRETVADELVFTRRAQGLPPCDPRPLLERLRLAHRATAHPRDLSSGERQRAAVAVILAAEPRALLLDEPTRGLDAASRAALAEILDELAAGGVAVLVATHDLELAARFARRSLLLERGRLANPQEAAP